MAFSVDRHPCLSPFGNHGQAILGSLVQLKGEDVIPHQERLADGLNIAAMNDNGEDSLEHFRHRVLGELSAIFAQSSKESVLEHALHTAFMRGALAGATHGGNAVVELAYRDQSRI